MTETHSIPLNKLSVWKVSTTEEIQARGAE
ncbi:hypothetical protein LCGC14_1373880 [marine sediment metagenome]|uniref:Uncharacterized protein n=1 Tax=marine sediment metagenome TaxID=412755 RepID=A0A0F9KQN5_9ZZZZ